MIGTEDLKAIDQYVDDPECRVEVKQAVVEFVNTMGSLRYKYKRTTSGDGLFELMLQQIRWYSPRVEGR